MLCEVLQQKRGASLIRSTRLFQEWVVALCSSVVLESLLGLEGCQALTSVLGRYSPWSCSCRAVGF